MIGRIAEIVDRLVDQFSDPYAFLRELVQNSLDAGSQRVEFEFHHAVANGTTVLLCSDTGEGMDEQAIDTRLTRIFASSKEDDLTKIGQFGIGFLSIFALKPSHVVVDTGRNGQAWRVHFHSNRTFTKRPLHEPVEGTRIRWVKKHSAVQHANFRRTCLEALERWCKYARAEILVDGESLNQPFAWEDPLSIHYQESGTEVALRPCLPPAGWVGFYNQGLTLAELNEPLVEGVEVKISSRYLEHTMTRDSVQRDKNFVKALQIVETVVKGQLVPVLLEAAALHRPGPVHGFLAAQLGRLSGPQREKPVMAGFGRHYSLVELAREAADHGHFLFAPEADELSQRLLEQGRRVLNWEGPTRQPGPDLLLGSVASQAECMEVHAAFALPKLIKPDLRQQRWLRRIHLMLTEGGELYQALWLANFSAQADALAYLICHQPSQPIPLNFQGAPGKARQLVLNVAHKSWANLWELDEDWGVQAACQPLWTVFPKLAGNTEARRQMVMRVMAQSDSC